MLYYVLSKCYHSEHSTGVQYKFKPQTRPSGVECFYGGQEKNARITIVLFAAEVHNGKALAIEVHNGRVSAIKVYNGIVQWKVEC